MRDDIKNLLRGIGYYIVFILQLGVASAILVLWFTFIQYLLFGKW